MIPELRQKFNSQFSEDRYNKFIQDIESTFGYKVEFRIAETPIFLPGDLKNELLKASGEILTFLRSKEYEKISENAVPAGLEVPGLSPQDFSGGQNRFPDMLAIDFAICREDGTGKLIPQLIELQGFPSLYCYQELLNLNYRKHFNLGDGLENFFSGLEHDSYLDMLRKIIIDGSEPENVVLLEIEPGKQKTRIDFSCTEKWLGIKPVCITEVTKEGKDLFYTHDNRKIKIERIYNRVIFNELKKRNDLNLNFNFRDELNVKWVPHPNWFFRISKYTLPFLKSRYVPPASFLNQIENYPGDLENYILKPLYSFAGSGVIYDVKKETLDSITDKQNYILQKKINYEPVIQTPDIPAKAEIRLLFLYSLFEGGKGDDRPVPVNNIVRLSKGKMMGVDFNKDKTWVGSSIAYYLA